MQETTSPQNDNLDRLLSITKSLVEKVGKKGARGETYPNIFFDGSSPPHTYCYIVNSLLKLEEKERGSADPYIAETAALLPWLFDQAKGEPTYIRTMIPLNSIRCPSLHKAARPLFPDLMTTFHEGSQDDKVYQILVLEELGKSDNQELAREICPYFSDDLMDVAHRRTEKDSWNELLSRTNLINDFDRFGRRAKAFLKIGGKPESVASALKNLLTSKEFGGKLFHCLCRPGFVDFINDPLVQANETLNRMLRPYRGTTVVWSKTDPDFHNASIVCVRTKDGPWFLWEGEDIHCTGYSPIVTATSSEVGNTLRAADREMCVQWSRPVKEYSPQSLLIAQAADELLGDKQNHAGKYRLLVQNAHKSLSAYIQAALPVVAKP